MSDTTSVKATFQVGDFIKQLRDTSPKCEICGYKAQSLVRHLREEHNLSAGQYHTRYPDAKIVSFLVREAMNHVRRIPMTGAVTLPEVMAMFSSQLKSKSGRTIDSSNFQVSEWKKRTQVYADKTLVPEVDPFFVFTPNANLIALSLTMGKNCLTSGPTGCGKTDEYLQVCAALDIPVRCANMFNQVTYSTFIGSMKLGPSGTYFEKTLLPLAMEGGYPVILDEVDFTPANIAALLYPVLSGKPSLYIPEIDTTIYAKKGFCVLATANTSGVDSTGQYAGIEVQNSAFLDRFAMKLLGSYLPPAEEEAMLEKRFGASERKLINQMVKFANEVRVAFLAGDIRVGLSTRKLIDFFEFRKYMPTVLALDISVFNWFDKEEAVFIRNLADQTGLLK